jgi:HTH-type transcriptional regulator / antitoxin HigA
MYNTSQLIEQWSNIAPQLNLVRPNNELEYQQLLELLDSITDLVKDPENNPYSALLDLGFLYANEWEERHHKTAIPDASPVEMLHFLMQQKNLKQKDLEQAGIADQGLLSNTLNEKRKISVAIAKRLAAFFKVPVDVFL